MNNDPPVPTLQYYLLVNMFMYSTSFVASDAMGHEACLWQNTVEQNTSLKLFTKATNFRKLGFIN
jgi:hypothetical protein